MIALLLFCGTAPAVQGQAMVGRLLGGSAMFYVGGGLYGPDTDALSAVLAADGYGVLEEAAQRWTTTGTQLTFGRFVVGLDRSTLRGGADIEGGVREADLDGATTLVRLGGAFPRGPLRFVPTLDIGVGRYELTLREPGAPSTVEGVFADPALESNLEARTPLIGASLGADVRLGGRARGNSRRARQGGPGLVLGLRAGYLAAIGEADWHYDDGPDLGGGPEATLAGPHVQLYLGLALGGRRR